MKQQIKPTDNHLFSLTENVDFNCFDLVLKQSSYSTSAELLGLLSFVHQLGATCSDELRIGARIENYEKIATKPKLILN